jgi:hypothetical protein
MPYYIEGLLKVSGEGVKLSICELEMPHTNVHVSELY